MKTYQITLPWPPSNNRYYRHNRGRTHISADGLAYRYAVASVIRSAFLGKMSISNNDRERSIELLAQYALTRCDRVSALRKLDAEFKPLVMHQLASFAFEDYSRSAASVKQCDGCNGEGFIDAEVFSMKSHTPASEKKYLKMSLSMGVEDIRPSEYEVRRKVWEVPWHIVSWPEGYLRTIQPGTTRKLSRCWKIEG